MRHYSAEVREVCEKSEDGYGGDMLFFSLLLNSPQEPTKIPLSPAPAKMRADNFVLVWT